MSLILLDTHFLIWLVKDPSELSAAETAVISDPDNDLAVSVASIWEMRTKWNARHANGQRKGVIPPDAGIDYATENRIDIAPLSASDCMIVLRPPPPHRDPFDEMLLVHAERLGARLLTRDRHLLGHPLALQL